MDEFEHYEMKLTTWMTLYHVNENDEFWWHQYGYKVPHGYHHNYTDRNNKCHKIGMDENICMEWHGPYKWLCKIISLLFYTN
jgi:hypothetical protein